MRVFCAEQAGRHGAARPVPGRVPKNQTDLSSIGIDLLSSVGRYASLTFNVGWRFCGHTRYLGQLTAAVADYGG